MYLSLSYIYIYIYVYVYIPAPYPGAPRWRFRPTTGSVGGACVIATGSGLFEP